MLIIDRINRSIYFCFRNETGARDSGRRSPIFLKSSTGIRKARVSYRVISLIYLFLLMLNNKIMSTMRNTRFTDDTDDNRGTYLS